MYLTKIRLRWTEWTPQEALYLIDKKLSRGGYDASYMKVHVLLNIYVFLGQFLIHMYMNDVIVSFFIYSLSHQIQQFLHAAISKISNLRINHWINFYSFNEIDVYLRYIISVSRAKNKTVSDAFNKKSHTWTFCPPPLYFSGPRVTCMSAGGHNVSICCLEKRRAFCNDEHNVTADKTWLTHLMFNKKCATDKFIRQNICI